MDDKSMTSPSKRARLTGSFGRRDSTSSSYPTTGVGRRESTSRNFDLQREDLIRRKEAEIKARAAEKLVEVRKRENAKTYERKKKDATREDAEKRVLEWTCNQAHRGYLGILLASLDTVLYSGHTWNPVAKEALVTPAQLKIEL